MSPDTEGSTLVGSGGFRIDRDRALDKLKRFQLPEPARFVLPLIRCAVAGGATRVDIKAGFPEGLMRSGQVSIEFDGRPFTREELADPCAVLFEEALPENVRNRDLATGLLTAFRLTENRAGLVSVSSGAGTERARIRLRSPLPDAPPSFDAGGGSCTVVLLSGAFVGSDIVMLRMKLRTLLTETLESYPMSVRVDGQEIPRSSGFDPEWTVSFDEGGVSGWLSVPQDLGGLSSITACRHGVAAGALVYSLPACQVVGWVKDDLLTLNVSQTGVVCNGRFEAAMAVVSAHAEKLVMKALGCFRERLDEAARAALSNGLDGFLRDCLDRGSLAGMPGLIGSLHRPVTAVLRGAFAPDLAAIRRGSRSAAWLLDVCERVPERERDQTPLSQALWKAPLFLGAGGETISIMDIRALARRMGFLPVSKTPMPLSRLPFVTVWLASDRHHRVLRLLAPAANWKDMTDAGQASEAVVRSGLKGKTALEVKDLARFGFADLLVRETVSFGSGRIEVGIPEAVPQDHARIYVFEGSGPRLLEGTPALGFAAVVSGSDTGSASGPSFAEACSAATDCAVWLYQRLAAAYRPGDTTKRNQSIMLHLLRFLSWAMTEASSGGRAWQLPESRRWAGRLWLFRTSAGWLDYEALRAAFDVGGILRVYGSWTNLEPSERKLAIMGSVYTKDLFEAILPGAGFLDFGGEEKAFLAFQTTQSKACEHKSSLGCLAAVDELGVHLTVDEYASGERLALPWGTVTVFGPGAGAPGLEEELAGAASVGLAVATSVVERFGTLWDQPGSGCRQFLLRVLMRLCSPWPGMLASGSRLDELLWVLPLFRSGMGSGLAWDAVARKLAIQREVSYALCGQEGSSEVADLALDDLELEALKTLTPEFVRKLKPVDKVREAIPPGPVAVPAPAIPALRAENPAASASPAAPGERGPAAPWPFDPPEFSTLRRILIHTRGTRGAKLLPGRVRWGRGGGGARAFLVAPGTEGEKIALVRSHPTVKAVESSGLDRTRKDLYLASIVFTAFNHLKAEVTDKDDARFHEAMAEVLASDGPQSGIFGRREAP